MSWPSRLDPDSVPRACPRDLRRDGACRITCVGEFHYLHHRADGTPYDDPNAMGRAVIHAAREAGIRITLLDACYLHGGIGEELDRSPAALRRRRRRSWAAPRRGARGRRRMPGSVRRSTASAPSTRTSAAIGGGVGRRAERAAPRPRLRAARRERGSAPRLRSARRPLLLGRCGCARRSLHRRPRARTSAEPTSDLLAQRPPRCCVCPTTERDLADGIGPDADGCAPPGIELALGSDSHAVIDLFEEARAVELDERLRDRGARHARPRARCFGPRPTAGIACLGWPEAGRIEPGAIADLVTVGLDSVRDGGDATRSSAVGALVFAATAADVSACRSPAAGRSSRTAAHVDLDVAGGARAGDPGGLGVTALVVDDIGLLVTNDSSARGRAAGDRPRRRAGDRGRRGRRRRAGGRGRRRADRRRRALRASPGFVDSHTHLVFAGDRADEFAARMAGRPYEAGGIRVTTEATRAATDDELRELDRAPPGRGHARRDHPPRDQVRLWARRPDTSSDCARSPPSSRTTPRSSAPTSCRRSTRAGPTTTSSSSAARCSRPARPTRGGSTSSASAVHSTPTSRAAVLEAGRDAGLGLRVHGNQLGPGPGVAARGRARALPRWTTARTSTTRTSRRWPAARPSPPSYRRPTSRPASPIPTRAGRSTPASRSRSRPTRNPGSSNTTSMSVLHRARGPRHADDHRGGGVGRRRWAARGRCAATTSAASRPARAPTRSILDAAELRRSRLPARGTARRRDDQRRRAQRLTRSVAFRSEDAASTRLQKRTYSRSWPIPHSSARRMPSGMLVPLAGASPRTPRAGARGLRAASARVTLGSAPQNSFSKPGSRSSYMSAVRVGPPLAPAPCARRA